MRPSDRPEIKSDEILVQEAQRGDTQAFNALIERHYGTVFAVAYARLSDPEVCEDLAQEVFLRAWLQVATLREGGRFAPWVTQMARHLATDWQRRGERESRLVSLVPMEETVDRIPGNPNERPGQAMAERQEQELARRAMELLPEDLREVALLHFVEGLGKSEIARQLGVHPSTVGRQLDSAVSLMKKSVESGLRQPSPKLKPGPLATARAMAVVAAVAAMTPEAKAAVAAAAAKSAALPAAGAAASAGAGTAASVSPLANFLTSSWAAISTGATTMGIGKTIALTTVVAASLAGGAYYYEADGNGIHGAATSGEAGGSATSGTSRGGKEVVQEISGIDFGKEVAFDAEFGTKYVVRLDPDNPIGLKDSSMLAKADGTTEFASEDRFGKDSSTIKLEPNKMNCSLTSGIPGAYGLSTFTLTEKNVHVFIWMDYRKDAIPLEKELIKSFLHGKINARTFRAEMVKMFQRLNIGPKDATERQRFYDQIALQYPTPSIMPD